ncbi:hypothetical protein [Methanococcus maripaludis]|uniref:Uncharacterized protein YwgA n=1 Tax=Methanococcus maripaludis TaxID=39152 RepID=A0A7J9S8H1_METMI|nr:hypothetical protein [Methanococcus maripaludis]MBB6496005.1 uncharacterized protein YwgA [Methanococcus maripaludis]
MENIFYDLEDEEKLVLYCIGALDNEPIKSKIKFQKMLFLVSTVFEGYIDILDFEPYAYGPYSETADSVVEDLLKLGLVTTVASRGTQYKLSEKGIEVLNELNPKNALMHIISHFKKMVNNMTDTELLVLIYTSFPEYTKNSVVWDDIKNKRHDIATRLLKKGIIDFKKALNVSGMDEAEFLKFVESKNIPIA